MVEFPVGSQDVLVLFNLVYFLRQITVRFSAEYDLQFLVEHKFVKKVPLVVLLFVLYRNGSTTDTQVIV